MTSERPFLDYYERLGRSPVRQDISDLKSHFSRRTALYQLLGIPPRLFALAEVLEFGPGLGHNALHVASFEPKRQVLVDASRAGLKGLQTTLREHFGSLDRFEIVEALAEEYHGERDFDIVLAENMIPMQREPMAFCRNLASHVRSGGVMVVTCMTASSTMGETLRRIVALKLAPPSLARVERIARLRGVFGAHLMQLPGVSRPVDDWIEDNITHPYAGRFFSIADAIDALGEDFDVYGGSPRFFTDWRWYKQIRGDRPGFNERALESYRGNVANLMDWRILLEPQDVALGDRLEEACGAVFWRMRAMEDGSERMDLADLARRCEGIAAILEPFAPRTAAAFEEVSAYLTASGDPAPETFFSEFASYFGRGVQYVSFIRR